MARFGFVAGLLLLPSTLGFLFPAARSDVKATTCQASRREGQEWGRQEVLSTGAAAAAGVLVSSLGLGGALPANAESTLAQRKVQYFRYAPRIKAGSQYYGSDFKKAVDSKDWAAINAAFQKQANAPSGSLRVNPKKFESRFDRELFGPMRIFAQSFAERGSSPKLAAMLEAEEAMEAAVMRIGKVATGDLTPVTEEEGGLFSFLFGSGGEKKPDPYAGKNQAQIAQAAWEDGKKAFNVYITYVNKGLTSEVNKLPEIN